MHRSPGRCAAATRFYGAVAGLRRRMEYRRRRERPQTV